MDLILWRHAEAQDPEGMMTDLDRPLTRRGDKQATRMAAWLDRQLPDGARVWSSPAVRCEETVLALGRKYKLRAELLPGGSPDDLLELVQWPRTRGAVLVVGGGYGGATVSKYIRLLSDQSIDVMMIEWHKWWDPTKTQTDLIRPMVKSGLFTFDRTNPDNPMAGSLYAVRL